MIQLFKKANDKAGAEVDPKDPTKQKWNADSVYVQIENEMVPLSELAKHAKENKYEAVESVENELEIDGAIHNVSDLIKNYKDAKKNDEAKEELEKGEKKGAEDTVVKKNEESTDVKKKDPDVKTDEGRKKDEEGDTPEDKKKNAEDEKEEKKENKDEEEETEEMIKKQSKANEKKDVRHFVRLNAARENGTTQGVLTIDTMHNKINRGHERYGSDKK